MQNVVAVQDGLCQAPIPCDVVNITLSVLNILHTNIIVKNCCFALLMLTILNICYQKIVLRFKSRTF